jgi:hypothetical protein
LSKKVVQIVEDSYRCETCGVRATVRLEPQWDVNQRQDAARRHTRPPVSVPDLVKESVGGAHDEPDAYAAGEDYFPEELEPRRYYEPVPRGLELKIREKLERLAQLDRQSPRRRRP